MGYDADAKKQERLDNRSLTVGGFVYPRRPMTVAADRELQKLAKEQASRIDDFRALSAKCGDGPDPDTGKMLLKAQRLSGDKLAAAKEELQAIADAVERGRFERVAAMFDSTEDEQALTADTLVDHLEFEDLDAIERMVAGVEEPTLGGEGPTGDSSSD